MPEAKTPLEDKLLTSYFWLDFDSTKGFYRINAYAAGTTGNSEMSKTLIGVLAILFGAYGIHHFFLGHIKRGVLYILFCWTLVPTVLSIAEGIHILCMSEEQFQRKYFPEQ